MQMRVESRVRICRMVVLLAIQWGDITHPVGVNYIRCAPIPLSH